MVKVMILEKWSERRDSNPPHNIQDSHRIHIVRLVAIVARRAVGNFLPKAATMPRRCRLPSGSVEGII